MAGLSSLAVSADPRCGRSTVGEYTRPPGVLDHAGGTWSAPQLWCVGWDEGGLARPPELRTVPPWVVREHFAPLCWNGGSPLDSPLEGPLLIHLAVTY